MSKFIQTLDDNGDPLIINLEAITHVIKTYIGLSIYSQNGCLLVLTEESANTLWEFMTAASWQINQPPQEDKKEGQQ